ncbi:MAG: efflux transporter periplasmic adaptor subunit [Deltaproteobacteria bacterium]|nr:efflux transporter periplasmic adaptor subunit [Deltaproteobacteria bacterium]
MSDMANKLDGLRIERPGDGSGGIRWWIPVLMMVVAAVLAFGWITTRLDAAEVVVAVAREVRLGDQQTVLNASGYVTARRQATVSSKITGKVLEVLIEEGMNVREGQVLARLDDANVRAAYRLSEAQLEAVRAELEETRVRRREAVRELARIRNLAARELVSPADLDAATANLESLDARLASQQVSVRVAQKGLAVARQSLDDTVIRAPFNGIVVAKNAQPGEMISPTSSGGFTRTGIGTIVDMTSLEIEVDVNEAYISRVSSGQPVLATLDAWPDWKIPGRVIAIIPTADRQKATVQVRVGFDALDPRILPEMGIKVAFQEASSADGVAATAILVPRAAIRTEGDDDLVWVVAGDRVERRAVRLSAAAGDSAVVLSGLAAGERVVLAGPTDLEDGDPVKEQSS